MKYGIVNYFNYNGLHMSRNIASKERMDALQDYDSFRPDDIIVYAYPKAGTSAICTHVYCIIM